MSNLKKYAYDWIACLFFLTIPIIMLHQIETSLVKQGVASGGPMQNAAIFPRIVAWILIGLAGLNVLRVLFGKISHFSPIEATDTTGLALIATAMFVVYLIVLPILGYHIMTIILLAALFRLLGLSLFLSCFGAVVASLGVAYVFEGLLNVVLPVGIFEIAVFS
ncbi:tripartite tricarboxylate transporter TctB family protein [uncultured Cohaesibacter sp.]|uniref:tripartite tricarboxylate transporter TctB family protein n=1 Tax=uncultured Cohaesibacter sp. TaxID=1002546 RepID=UPI002AA80232|nr:tripartite tricarboxylate transporter TctB family protein [uncultured Cohaesibacter sp.]